MVQLSAALLSLTGEAALLAKGGKILFANDAACSLLGPTCREKSLAALLGREIAGMQAPSFVGEAEAGGQRVLLRIKSLDGGTRVIFITPRTTVEALVGDSFLYALRTELMQLGTGVSLIRARSGGADEGVNSALRGISQCLYRINRTLQNLSVIRGAELETLSFRPQPLELCRLLRDLIDSVRLNLPQPEILFSAPDDLPIHGDPALLEMLVLNLLSNCLSHAKGCTRIRVSLHGSGEQVILSVNDDGCGIPADKLHTVLERYRFEGNLTDVDHGPGLGLTAVREIARLHGGTLLLESREGIGTAVRVSLHRSPRALNPVKTAVPEYNRDYNTILTGLACCLPPEAFDMPDR